jgi:hypothetical protein
MTEHDERIEELLAGYALGALGPDDLAGAELALSEHVPGCATCRSLLSDFQGVAGELALAAAPAEPSSMLETRVRRSIDGGAPSRRWSRGRALLAGSAAMLVLVLGASTAFLATRVSRAEQLEDAMAAGFRTLADPASRSVDMAEGAPFRLYVTYVPGSDRMVLMGLNLPEPEGGETYRLWGLAGESSTLLAEFSPDDDGLVAIELEGNAEAFDHLVCDVVGEDAGPSPGETIWGGAVHEAAAVSTTGDRVSVGRDSPYD